MAPASGGAAIRGPDAAKPPAVSSAAHINFSLIRYASSNCQWLRPSRGRHANSFAATHKSKQEFSLSFVAQTGAGHAFDSFVECIDFLIKFSTFQEAYSMPRASRSNALHACVAVAEIGEKPRPVCRRQCRRDRH
jgi:hypothetical protein